MRLLHRICLLSCSLSFFGCSIEPEEIVRGRLLLQQYQCGTCHTIPGVDGAHGTFAVSLADMGMRSYIAGRIPNRDDNLVRWIEDPAALVPGTRMPDMGVTRNDARLIAGYLHQLH